MQETYYYDIRKQVFEYDEVMNNQRKAVYTERHRVLDGRELKAQVIGYGERTSKPWMPYANRWACAATANRIR